jgi:signal transduction histidine kinase
MTEVITSMLDVSQIDVEAMELHFVETTLSSIVKLAIEPYAEAIHERKQSLTARGLRNLPPIKGDFKRLVQAFQNLVTNAIKFTPDGGKIDIEAQVFETDEQGKPVSVQVIITDSGIGISKEHHQLIFEKFFRVGPTALHSSGRTKFKGAGPGLGLPIARGIIEAHGGQIWVESDKQDESTLPGSTFYVVLPINPPAVEAQKRLRQVQDAQDTTVVRLGAAAGAPGDTAPPPG